MLSMYYAPVVTAFVAAVVRCIKNIHNINHVLFRKAMNVALNSSDIVVIICQNILRNDLFTIKLNSNRKKSLVP